MNLKFDQREAYYRKRRATRPLRFCAFAAICVFVIAVLIWGYYWYIMKGTCSFTIRSQQNLTQEMVDVIGSRSGVEAFSPVLQENVTLKVNDYETDVLLTGVDFDVYPLEYDTWVSQLSVGSQSVVLVGQGCFSALMDYNRHIISEEDASSLLIACKKSLGNGYGEEADWISEEERMMIEENREEFDFAIQMGEDTLDTIAGGVLKSPENEIVISYESLHKLLAESAKDTGVKQAWLTVKGMKNAADLQEELLMAGMEADTDLIQQMETYQAVQRNCLLLMVAAGILGIVLYQYLVFQIRVSLLF